MTSNHNDSIHSVLFQIVRKTEAVGLYTMKLGAALTVIRYNDGFSRVERVLEMLGVNVGVHMYVRFVQLANRRIICSEGIVATEQRRFVKRQRRGHKLRKLVREDGEVILLENSLLLNPILRDQQRRQQQLIPLQLVIVVQSVASVRRVE